MKGRVNISENEWLRLGSLTKSIRDCIMDFIVISCNRFGASSKMYKNFKTLDSYFLSVRSKLDDFVSSAYPLDKHSIGDGCSITSVFFGERMNPCIISPAPYKRGQLPMSFDQVQEQEFGVLLQNIDLLLTSINKHPYIVARFKEKDSKAKLVRFKKAVQRLQK